VPVVHCLHIIEEVKFIIQEYSYILLLLLLFSSETSVNSEQGESEYVLVVMSFRW